MDFPEVIFRIDRVAAERNRGERRNQRYGHRPTGMSPALQRGRACLTAGFLGTATFVRLRLGFGFDVRLERERIVFGSEKEQVIRAGEFAIARKIVVIRVRPKRGFLGLMFVKQLGAIEALAGQWHGIRNIGIRSSVFRARLENPFPVRHVFPHERG